MDIGSRASKRWTKEPLKRKTRGLQVAGGMRQQIASTKGVKPRSSGTRKKGKLKKEKKRNINPQKWGKKSCGWAQQKASAN